MIPTGLGSMVAAKLEEYFQALQGERPSFELYAQVIREVEKPLISMTLKQTQGNKIKAAEMLGINRNTLRKKMREHNIE